MSYTVRGALESSRQPSAPIWTVHGKRGCMCSYCVHERSWVDLADRLDSIYFDTLRGIEACHA